ncbi:L-2,4-diaminobutyrate decarboxylase [Maioricimonas rarisocia]|uniref:L-2,4-diaminobutyrate decarboxylase n=1 Tax=Maioricimonas rarisocia TaxID=2528026 RepID=A0A517Z1Z1_9PLAN|nr:pyridoxal-dependent decarboxylase [Maioricimonas rarisocia]QDU36500.1 L-2,4-diaminobutyrate decarboxylase [Maioricimonas rarisocia]
MTGKPSSLETARQRIAAAYSPDLFGTLAGQLASTLTDHFSRVESNSGPVLNWTPPTDNIAAAESWLDRSPAADAGVPQPEELQQQFARCLETMLARGNNLHSPRYLGHQVPASVPLAALFDLIGSATNQVMAIYEMGPWATAVERAVVERVGTQLGLPAGNFAGLITHGGSLANLTALLTARNVALGDAWEAGFPQEQPRPVLVAHSDAHYCITRAAGVLGLGTRQVIPAPLDDRRRMDPAKLDELLADLRGQGRQVVAVSACACATPIGAFDPLNDIADVCEKHDVWMHVDAAHGGAAGFSEQHRHLLDGLARADSFICDAHKMMFVPALCAFVFYRNPVHRFETFRQDAPYLFDPSAPGLADYDSGLTTVECTKRAAAYGLWGLWSLFGPRLFADMVDVTFELGRQLYNRLVDAPDFEPLHAPECNIVVFRHIPEELRDAAAATIGEFNRRIRRELIESGEFYIVQTNIDGVGALRVTLINPLTEEQHLDRLLGSIRRIGSRLLEG